MCWNHTSKQSKVMFLGPPYKNIPAVAAAASVAAVEVAVAGESVAA